MLHKLVGRELETEFFTWSEFLRKYGDNAGVIEKELRLYVLG